MAESNDHDTAAETAADDNVPNDNTTLSEVLTGYEDAGLDGQFSSVADGQIECVTCGRAQDAALFTVTSRRRMEGASDPDDMLSVIALRCPNCGAAGTLILGYGPTASAEDQDISVGLRDVRTDGAVPPDASPADMADSPPDLG